MVYFAKEEMRRKNGSRCGKGDGDAAVSSHQRAYEAVERLLKETGRAEVVHPTGTGEPFVAFRLTEEHPQTHFLWLTPSRYIFQTQQEAYARASGAPAPENICFYTYAALSMMDEQMLEELRADCIILDEFHRCGAKEWSRGVEALLEQCPDAPVLGLSATSIRYLDNERGMADELFDGCIASEMTLGEAIGRGILPAPKYVYRCTPAGRSWSATGNGFSVQTARSSRRRSRLSPERIARLDEIGMIWQNRHEDQLERVFAEVQRWYDAHGNLDVPVAHIANGIRLGCWAARQRECAAQAERLDALNV